MDTASTFTTREDRPKIHTQTANGMDGQKPLNWPLNYPIKLLGDAALATFKVVRPIAPHLIPYAIFLLALPVIAFLSLSAGWIVWRSGAVAWEKELFLQYGDGGPPYAEVLLSSLAAKQPYDISIELVVPASETNLALGNFMTTLTLLSPANKTLALIRHPAIVTPPSAAPWSTLLNRAGTVKLNIPLLSSFVVDTTRAVARVELGRRDQWKSIGSGEGRELSVLSALLRGVVVHKGVRGLVSRFPFISAMVAAGTFLFMSFVVLASCLLPALEWRFNNEPPFREIPVKPRRRPRRRFSASAADTDEKDARRPKARRRSRSATRRPSVDVCSCLQVLAANSSLFISRIPSRNHWKGSQTC
ncbi:hypothetical protein AcW1_000724 [Taiwanofungus camphoratus]|nr:hypothetical protein AcW2_000774 [Antrodia cinnamomea]KAI0936506.1 hypothetical protein AcV5_004624 [Antrodia cinnamomea]KAI0961720.1 hypothetical protein AcV7_000744 [Antrodia cinnamomea]KAI0963731.1 hypothetical protein AcW1_000724 [Antrodia cinnamomea]